uniref:Uncharacterized protein n=1 Tax=Amphimedon queenslandica TaxID=400682 RepID=A0A1X7UV35_AMPQE
MSNKSDANDHKPFLVTFETAFNGYWLLEPPSDSSKLVKSKLSLLQKSNDGLLVNEVEREGSAGGIIDQIVMYLEECPNDQQIRIGSQCNRLIKHIQVSAIYLAHYKEVGIASVTNLHTVMKWLFALQPPREANGVEMLSSITTVASALKCSAESRATTLRRAVVVLSEVNADGSICFGSIHSAIQKFLSIAKESLTFWECLVSQFKQLEDLGKNIMETASKIKPGHPLFDEFKRNVLSVSAGWAAIKLVSMQYISNLSKDCRLSAEAKVPNLSNDYVHFNEFACIVSSHFLDIESYLMTDDYKMQEEVRIYSTWVKPTKNTSISECLHTVEEVKELVQRGKVKSSAIKLSQITQQSRRIRSIIEVYVNRLEALEDYAMHQQEKIMWKMNVLEEEKKKRHKAIQSKEQEIDRNRADIKECEQLKSHAESNMMEAERRKREAEERREELENWWWVPVYGLILGVREMIQDNSAIINRESDKMERYSKEASNFQSNINSAESTIESLRNDVSQLSQQIEDLGANLKMRIQMLREMKETTATLKAYLQHWNELSMTMAYGQNRSVALEKIVHKASTMSNPEKILTGRGTEKMLNSFTEAFQKAEELLKTQWQYVVSYNYICELCQKENEGLPLPVNNDAVVCNSCAHKFVE